MRTTIDRAGRLVVPKPLRDAMGLLPGTALELSERDGTLVVEPAPVPMRLARRGRRVAADPARRLPPLTADMVRNVLESGRR